MPSTCCCRKRNVNAAAIRAVAPTQKRWPQGPRSIAARQAARTTIAALASLLNRPIVALDPDLQPMDPSAVALIDESRCIGCALCLPACPVDAISGAAGTDAHGDRAPLHGLRTVHSGVPGRLHRDGRRCARSQPNRTGERTPTRRAPPMRGDASKHTDSARPFGRSRPRNAVSNGRRAWRRGAPGTTRDPSRIATTDDRVRARCSRARRHDPGNHVRRRRARERRDRRDHSRCGGSVHRETARHLRRSTSCATAAASSPRCCSRSRCRPRCRSASSSSAS